MTQDEIIEIAKEAGLQSEYGVSEFAYTDRLEHFSKLVAAKKQERIIEVVERLGTWAHITEVVAKIRGEA